MVYRQPSSALVGPERYWHEEYADPARVTSFYGRRRWQPLLDKAESLVGKGRWLDVGCGPGHLLKAAAEAGWKCAGIDCSPEAVAMARQKGVNAICGRFPDETPDECQDVISIVQTLEYVENPKHLLGECRKRLNRGGVLMLLVKNFSFWQHAERWFRARSGIWCPADICTYSADTLRRLCTLTGFDVIETVPAEIVDRPRLSAALRLWWRLTGLPFSPNILAIARPHGSSGGH